MHDFQKIYHLDHETWQKIIINFDQKDKNKYKFTIINPKIQNNSIKAYIKNLDLLYENIEQQKTNLEILNNLFAEFSEFFILNKELQNKEITVYDKQQTSDFFKKDNFVYKIGKEICNITTTCQLIEIGYDIESIPTLDVATVNNEVERLCALCPMQKQVINQSC